MNQKLKECRNQLNTYFQGVRHSIHFVPCGRNTIVDIEYEDFLGESNVRSQIRDLIGNRFLINLKRVCTNRILTAVRKSIPPGIGRKELYSAMSEFEGDMEPDTNTGPATVSSVSSGLNLKQNSLSE